MEDNIAEAVSEYLRGDLDDGRTLSGLPVSSLDRACKKAGLPAGVFMAVVHHIEQNPLSDASQYLEEVRRQEAIGSLVMWRHQMDPESCPCQQCGYMRDDTERIRRIHGGG